MMRIISIFLLVLGFLNLQAQIAGVNDQKVFSLNDCIEIALRNNYDIRLADARAQASGADVTQAFGQFLPSLAASGNYNRTLDQVFFTEIAGQLIPITNFNPNNFRLYAGAQWTVFDGFERGNNYTRAHESFNSYDLNARQERMRIKIRIYQDYIDVIESYQIVKMRNENLELGKKELERITAQSQAGLIALDILYSQEADLGNKEYELISAENSLNQAKANLLVSMGLTPDISADFLESSLPDNIDSAVVAEFRTRYNDFKSVLNSAFENRLDFHSAEANLKASEASVSASYAGYFPRISLSGGWSWSNYEISDFDKLANSSIGLNLSIPIFDQFSTNLQVQNASLRLEQAMIQKKQLEQNIMNSVRIAYLNLDAAEKQLDISRRAVKYAELNNNSLKEKFRVGTVGINEYLTANTQLITAQINSINAVYRYFRSQKEVLFAIGLLD